MAIGPITPVANDVNPPNLQQGLGTLSSILGLSQQQLAVKQAQQNLQTGQYQQQQEQAGAQQQQEMMRERQVLQQAQGSGKDDQGNSLNDANGEPDPLAYTKFASRALPLLGQNVIQSIVKTQSDRANLYKSNLGLSNDQRETAAGIVRSQIGTNTPSSQILSQVQQALGNNPSAQSNAASLQPLLAHLDGVKDQQQRDKALTHLADSYSPQAQVAGSQTTAPVQSFAPSGSVQTTESNWKAPGGVGAQLGPQVSVGLGPTQTPAYQAKVAGATAAATGSVGIDTQRAKQVSDSIQPSTSGIQLTQEVDGLADQISSGKISDAISRAAANLGISADTYARQLLKKDLGQLKSVATVNAPSNDARTTIESGYPEATSDPQTIHGAMDFIRGSFRQNLERGQRLQSYQQKNPDNAGFQHADDAFTTTMNPLMSEFRSLTTPQAKQGFFKRNFTDAADAQSFLDKVKGASHALGQ